MELGLDDGPRLHSRFACALVLVGLGHGPVLLRRLPVGGLAFDAHRNCFANELGRRNCSLERCGRTNLRSVSLWRGSDEIAWQCECYSEHGVMKLCESGGTLAVDMGVPVSKMKESIAAHYSDFLEDGPGS